eukprot:486158-Amphidinium_carterae.2
MFDLVLHLRASLSSVACAVAWTVVCVKGHHFVCCPLVCRLPILLATPTVFECVLAPCPCAVIVGTPIRFALRDLDEVVLGGLLLVSPLASCGWICNGLGIIVSPLAFGLLLAYKGLHWDFVNSSRAYALHLLGLDWASWSMSKSVCLASCSIVCLLARG